MALRLSMRRTLTTLAVIALLFSAGSAWKAEAGEYKVLGPGAQSCGTWTKKSNEDSWLHVQQTAWVLGYITAFNTWGPFGVNSGTQVVSDVSKGVDVDGILAWIDNWCRANPLDTVSWAAGQLMVELIKRKAN